LLLEDKGQSARKPLLGPEKQDARAEAQWRAMQEQQNLHANRLSRPAGVNTRRSTTQVAVLSSAKPQVDPRADAMWLYTNASNLDAFLREVYRYYVGHGVWSILLSRALNSLTELFVFSFAMFLTTCIDYSKIPSSKSTGEVLIPKCMAKASWLKNAALFFFVIYWLWQLAQHIADVRRLFRMHDFFLHVLNINDVDIQTVSWVRVVDGLVKVQDANVATANPRPSMRKYLDYKEPQQRLSAESIANRLMRQDNYYVALYNKDVLDFTLPLPFVGSRQFYSKSLEWCIDFCLTNFIFDEQGSIRPFCLEVKNRQVLVEALRARLRFAAITSVVIAPFNILRFCIVFFFKYYTEFTRNPARASARTFTPFAEWKIREFNELEHLFERRIRQAYPFAKEYLAQFPKDKTDQVCRFVAFVSGAVAAVLTLATLFDPELFLTFQITPGRTAVFWLTVMVGIFGVAHGSLPDENEIHDPVLHLKEVLVFTHYLPSHWKDRLHSDEVRAEFSAMYQMKVVIFVEEILSLIVAPWILWRNSGKRTDRIVDFFREQTVHVEGIGHQCNFAVFGFKKDLNAEDPIAVLNEPDGLRDDYYGLKDDKMASSVQNFMQYYSHYNHRAAGRRPHGWQPPPAWPPVMPTQTSNEGPNARASSSKVPYPSGRKPVGITSPRQQATTSKMQQRHPGGHPRQQPIATSRYDDHPRGGPSRTIHEVSESGLMANDSDLREFADGPGRKSQTSDRDDADDNEDEAAGGNPGVLGMLYQFSKAQADKGAGAVM
jgi:autophagy-related protein 9